MELLWFVDSGFCLLFLCMECYDLPLSTNENREKLRIGGIAGVPNKEKSTLLPVDYRIYLSPDSSPHDTSLDL